MKKSILVVLAISFSTLSFGQNFKDFLEVQSSALKTEKKALVTQVMNFTEEESKVFWPLYNEFQTKLGELNQQRFELIVQYAENFDSLTSDMAVNLMSENLKIKEEMAHLDKKYFKKFEKILEPKRAVKYFQVELDIQLAVNGQLAQVLPFVE